MVQRIITSAIYALVAVAAAYQASGMPQNADAWGGLIVLAITTFWAKYSSNTTIIAPNRAAWTDQQRKQEALDELNKGLPK